MNSAINYQQVVGQPTAQRSSGSWQAKVSNDVVYRNILTDLLGVAITFLEYLQQFSNQTLNYALVTAQT